MGPTPAANESNFGEVFGCRLWRYEALQEKRVDGMRAANGSNNGPEETVAELCEQADVERELEKLLELASKLQSLIEAQRSPKEP